MSSYVSYSDQIHYQIQSSIFTALENYTKPTNRNCIPALLACGVSNLENLAWLVATTGEKIIRGSSLLIIAPFSSDYNRNIEKGYTLLKQISYDWLDFFRNIPTLFIRRPSYAILNPKYFILVLSLCSKVDNKHARSGTFGSEDHIGDLWRAEGEACVRSIMRTREEWQKEPLAHELNLI